MSAEEGKDSVREIRDDGPSGRRVLVIWVCWLVLAVFLAAAGAVTF